MAYRGGAAYIGAIIAAVFGKWRWNDNAKAQLARLTANQLAPVVKRYDERELEGLPSV